MWGARAPQGWLAAATSGLSCSAACTVFFEADGVTLEEPPDRAWRKRCSHLGFEQRGDLHQRQVRLRRDRAQDEVAMRLDAMRALISALRLGACRAALAPLLHVA